MRKNPEGVRLMQPTLAQVAYAYYACEVEFEDRIANRGGRVDLVQKDTDQAINDVRFEILEGISSHYLHWFKRPYKDEWTYPTVKSMVFDGPEGNYKLTWDSKDVKAHLDFSRVTVCLDEADPTVQKVLQLAAERRDYVNKSQELGDDYYCSIQDRAETIDHLLKQWVRGEDLVCNAT